jgi:hypothetical protein
MRHTILFSFVAACSVCLADMFMVDPSGGGDFLKIQDAINASVYGDTVQVLAGTYDENITLKNGVALIGAGDNTIIDGNQHGSVVTSSNCDSSTLLEGFMITNGEGYGWDTLGGMYNYRSNPTVRNCTFSNNTSSRGGGMYNYFSNPTVKNCTFSDNAASDGGGMYNNISSPAITNCMFSGNTAFRGGGIFNHEGSSPIVTYCTFDRNQAHEAGGGVYSDGGDLTVSNCKFVDNVAEGSWEGPFVNPEATIGEGGALYLKYRASCEMVNCTLTGNRAYEAGGGLWLYNDDHIVTLTNCILWNNRAALSESGDEIENYRQYENSPVISHCDIAGCGGSGAGWNASMGIDGGGNIDADPLFKGANGAVQLDGLDDHVKIPGYTGISGGASRTSSAWIKTTATQPEQIVSWGSSAVGQKWGFRMESDGSLGVGVWGGYIKTTTQLVNDGNWHHVAAVLADDGSILMACWRRTHLSATVRPLQQLTVRMLSLAHCLVLTVLTIHRNFKA